MFRGRETESTKAKKQESFKDKEQMNSTEKAKKENQKSEVASFRLLSEAHKVLYERAKTAGVSTRVWLEKAILENQTKIIAKQKPQPDLRSLLFQVNKAGNNINQLAHHFNTLNKVNKISKDEYLTALETLENIHNDLKEAIHYARQG